MTGSAGGDSAAGGDAEQEKVQDGVEVISQRWTHCKATVYIAATDGLLIDVQGVAGRGLVVKVWANGHLHGHQVPGRVVNHRDKAGHWPEHQTGGDGLPNQNGGYNHRLEWLQSLKGDRK
ncbi:hypothetical protein TYRP_021460 [Tyrophagus putrescentiae]|nr:hypothetical protein TYRP_021460 [Tyrophagus putrescentiae]